MEKLHRQEHHQILSGDQMKEDEIYREFSMQGSDEKCVQELKYLKGRDHFGDLDRDGGY